MWAHDRSCISAQKHFLLRRFRAKNAPSRTQCCETKVRHETIARSRVSACTTTRRVCALAMRSRRSEQPHQRRRRGSGTSHAPHSLGPSEVQVSRDERKRVGCGLRSATAQPRARSTEKTRGRHAPNSRRAVFLQCARVDFWGGARLIAKIVQSSPLVLERFAGVLGSIPS